MVKKFNLILGNSFHELKKFEDNSFDVVMTDPPYPNLKGGVTGITGFGVAKNIRTTESVGENWGNDISWLQDTWRVTKYGMFIFCSHSCVADFKNALPDANAINLFVWYKRNAMHAIRNVPRYTTEFIWAFEKEKGLNWKVFKNSMFDIPKLQGGCMAVERIQNTDGTSFHPTQKPVKLMQELMQCGGETFLDCFMGTGTTGLAAMKEQRIFTGIEMNEKYFEMAEKRISAEANQIKLFLREEKKLKEKDDDAQSSLWNTAIA